MRSLIAHEYMDKFTGPDKLFKSLDQMTGDVDMTCNVEEFAQILASRYLLRSFVVVVFPQAPFRATNVPGQASAGIIQLRNCTMAS